MALLQPLSSRSDSKSRKLAQYAGVKNPEDTPLHMTVCWSAGKVPKLPFNTAYHACNAQPSKRPQVNHLARLGRLSCSPKNALDVIFPNT